MHVILTDNQEETVFVTQKLERNTLLPYFLNSAVSFFFLFFFKKSHLCKMG